MFNNLDGGWGAKRGHVLPEIKPRRKTYHGSQSDSFKRCAYALPKFFTKLKRQKP